METYTADNIYAIWIDGFDTPGSNGSLVGKNPYAGDGNPFTLGDGDYPHYRAAMPLSVVVRGQYKLVYSWDATIRTDISVSDARMLFDLSTDPGEFHNITPSRTDLAASLYADLDRYLTSVDAWRPRDDSAA